METERVRKREREEGGRAKDDRQRKIEGGKKSHQKVDITSII